MNLLQSIENALTLYGKTIKTESERTQERLKNYQKNKWLNCLLKRKNADLNFESKNLERELCVLETAVAHLKTYPSEYASIYFEILYHRYLAPQPLDKTAVMMRLFIEERTYYRRKKEALSLLALILTLDEH